MIQRCPSCSLRFRFFCGFRIVHCHPCRAPPPPCALGDATTRIAPLSPNPDRHSATSRPPRQGATHEPPPCRRLRPAHTAGQVHERHPALVAAPRRGMPRPGSRLRGGARLRVVLAPHLAPVLAKYALEGLERLAHVAAEQLVREDFADSRPRFDALRAPVLLHELTDERLGVRSEEDLPECSSWRNVRRTSTSSSRSIQPSSSIAVRLSATMRCTLVRPRPASHRVASSPNSPIWAPVTARVSFSFAVLSCFRVKRCPGSYRRLSPSPFRSVLRPLPPAPDVGAPKLCHGLRAEDAPLPMPVDRGMGGGRTPPRCARAGQGRPGARVAEGWMRRECGGPPATWLHVRAPGFDGLRPSGEQSGGGPCRPGRGATIVLRRAHCGWPG